MTTKRRGSTPSHSDVRSACGHGVVHDLALKRRHRVQRDGLAARLDLRPRTRGPARSSRARCPARKPETSSISRDRSPVSRRPLAGSAPALLGHRQPSYNGKCVITSGPTTFLALIGSALAGLVLGLVISFKRITNPPSSCAYAVVEGVLLGVVSRLLRERLRRHRDPGGRRHVRRLLRHGGALQVPGHAGDAEVHRWVIGALIGVVVLMLVNFVFCDVRHQPRPA